MGADADELDGEEPEAGLADGLSELGGIARVSDLDQRPFFAVAPLDKLPHSRDIASKNCFELSEIADRGPRDGQRDLGGLGLLNPPVD